MGNSISHRDPRIDFFRGLAFIIILIAHIPSNWMARWIPARFGFSDATEMFVFMSGFAAGLAFGATFYKAGQWLGTARIFYRAWQVYVAHLLLFFFVAMSMVIANDWFDTRDYVGQLNLYYFFQHTTDALVGLFTLTYVPNYFDILPMYIVVLMMMPIVVALAKVHPWLAFAACIALYAYNWFYPISLPAEVAPDRDRAWFFNPFAWQLIFFTGFSFAMGWLKLPPLRWWLVAACVALVVVGVLVSHRPIWEASVWLTDLRAFLLEWRAKTQFGILRYLHFLALAYLVVWALKGREDWLRMGWAAPVLQCGQQSLPVFLFAMFLSRLYGIALDHISVTPWEREWYLVVLVNIVAIANLVGVAYLLGWIKSEPWRVRRPAGQADRAKDDRAKDDRPMTGAAVPARQPAE